MMFFGNIHKETLDFFVTKLERPACCRHAATVLCGRGELGSRARTLDLARADRDDGLCAHQHFYPPSCWPPAPRAAAPRPTPGPLSSLLLLLLLLLRRTTPLRASTPWSAAHPATTTANAAAWPSA